MTPCRDIRSRARPCGAITVGGTATSMLRFSLAASMGPRTEGDERLSDGDCGGGGALLCDEVLSLLDL